MFHQKDCYFEDDQKRIAYFRKNPLNEDASEVLVKISTMEHKQIDELFASRQVIADHIVSLHVDVALQQGLLQVVDAIAHLETPQRNYFLYSFATRYCNWHNVTAYPIYDVTTHHLLAFFWRSCQLDTLSDEDFFNYPRFKECMITLREAIGMERYTFKEVDKFIWIFGERILQNVVCKRPLVVV